MENIVILVRLSLIGTERKITGKFASVEGLLLSQFTDRNGSVGSDQGGY